MFNEIITRQQTMYVIAGFTLVLIVLFIWYVSRRRKSGGSIAGADLGEIIHRLRATNAQWPTIAEELNPKNDTVVSSLLKELRGPHMFVPHTALNIIENAYDATLRTHPRANVRDVLKNACGSMNKVIKYGD